MAQVVILILGLLGTIYGFGTGGILGAIGGALAGFAIGTVLVMAAAAIIVSFEKK